MTNVFLNSFLCQIQCSAKNLKGDISRTRRWSMRAIVVTDQASGTAGMKLMERPEPKAAINDVVVQVHASGFVPT